MKDKQIAEERPIVTIRSHSGISGDILLTGFALLNLAKLGIDPLEAEGRDWLNEQIAKILPEPDWSITLQRQAVHGVNGWRANISLPHSHTHNHIWTSNQREYFLLFPA